MFDGTLLMMAPRDRTQFPLLKQIRMQLEIVLLWLTGCVVACRGKGIHKLET